MASKTLLIGIEFLVFIAIAVIILLMLLSPVQEQERTIKVGVLVPLSGVRAEAGEYITRGLDLAMPEINNNASIKYRIELIFEDSRYEPKTALTAFNKLKDIDRVRYVIGAFGSSETLAVAPIAEENKMILITPASQTTEITKAGDYIFRTQINTGQEAPFWAEFIANKTGDEPVHIMEINTDYGFSYVKDFTPALEKHGGKTGIIEKYETTDTDFRTQLTKVKSEGPEYILVIGTPKQTGLILKQAEELGITAIFFGTSPIEGQELIKIGGSVVDGILYPYPYDALSNFTNMKIYREKYRTKYNETPEMYSAIVYDTLYLLSLCFEKAGDSVEGVKQCLYGVRDFQGASGILSFDENGDVMKPIVVKTIRGGQFMKYE